MDRFMFMLRKESLKAKRSSIIINGEISEIKITNISGANPLKGQNLKDFEIFFKNMRTR